MDLSSGRVHNMSYDLIAADYDAAFAWESDPVEIIPVWERLGKPARVIEAACGPARLLATLVGRGVYGVGIDISEPMLELARVRLAAAGGEFELHRARLEDFALSERCAGAFCAVGSFGHLSTKPAARRHLGRMHEALEDGARYAVQIRLQPLRDTKPRVPDASNSWEFDCEDGRLRYSWYGTGINARAAQEVQRSRFEWLSGARQGEVVETDHLMSIWDWERWQTLVASGGFVHVASFGSEDDDRELQLGTSLYDNPYAWHVLERSP